MVNHQQKPVGENPDFQVEPRPVGIPTQAVRYGESIVRQAGVDATHLATPIPEGHVAMGGWDVDASGKAVKVETPEK